VGSLGNWTLRWAPFNFKAKPNRGAKSGVADSVFRRFEGKDVVLFKIKSVEKQMQKQARWWKPENHSPNPCFILTYGCWESGDKDNGNIFVNLFSPSKSNLFLTYQYFNWIHANNYSFLKSDQYFVGTKSFHCYNVIWFYFWGITGKFLFADSRYKHIQHQERIPSKRIYCAERVKIFNDFLYSSKQKLFMKKISRL
jgi:hypothetical protein